MKRLGIKVPENIEIVLGDDEEEQEQQDESPIIIEGDQV